MSAGNLREWLEKLAPPGHGRSAEIARITGLSQPYISRILAGKTKGMIRGRTVVEMAEHMHRDPSEVLNEIFDDGWQNLRHPVRQDSDVVVPIDAKYRREWDFLFQKNPLRAKRVLENMILQERKGYTEFISRMVSQVLESGPAGCLDGIAHEVRLYKKRLERAKRDRNKSQHPTATKPKHR